MTCPCCTGRYEGEFWDLCDPCMEASLAGQFPHPCKRNWTTEDIIRLSRVAAPEGNDT